MQFTTALLALLVSSGFVAAAPGGSPGGYGYGQCKDFQYSSTCSAVYTTKTQTTSYPYTTTISVGVSPEHAVRRFVQALTVVTF